MTPSLIFRGAHRNRYPIGNRVKYGHVYFFLEGGGGGGGGEVAGAGPCMNALSEKLTF